MTPHETARHSVLCLRSCQVWHSPGDVPFVTFVAMACKRSGVQIPSAPPRTPGQTIRRWQDVQLSWVRVRTPARELMRRTGLEARIGAGNFHLLVEDAVAAFRGHSVTRSASPRINRPGGRHL